MQTGSVNTTEQVSKKLTATIEKYFKRVRYVYSNCERADLSRLKGPIFLYIPCLSRCRHTVRNSSKSNFTMHVNTRARTLTPLLLARNHAMICGRLTCSMYMPHGWLLMVVSHVLYTYYSSNLVDRCFLGDMKLDPN